MKVKRIALEIRELVSGIVVTVAGESKMRKLLLLSVLLVTFACTSTGTPNHPIKFYGWRMYLYGHEKYTPEEKIYARCLYRNRLPDGSKTGFHKSCSIESTQFPMGINRAMYVTGCVMEKCTDLALKED